jgi:hypothetical protein
MKVGRMTSGYEKSPDYGGTEPSGAKLVIVCLLVLAMMLAGLWFAL